MKDFKIRLRAREIAIELKANPDLAWAVVEALDVTIIVGPWEKRGGRWARPSFGYSDYPMYCWGCSRKDVDVNLVANSDLIVAHPLCEVPKALDGDDEQSEKEP
jgi:hypothetical protein